jgi:DNA polymerase-1
MLLQIHDELIFEVPKDELEKTVQVAREVMEHTMQLDVPLVTEARIGDNWGELEPLSDTLFEALENTTE